MMEMKSNTPLETYKALVKAYLNNTSITQILEGHKIFGFPKSVQITSTKGQCGEVLVNGCQQLLCSGQPQWHVANFKIFHVMATF